MSSIRFLWTSVIVSTVACGGETAPQPSAESTTSSVATLGANAHRPLRQQVVERTDIVSDQPGAEALDPTLVNAWGLAFNPLGFAWVSATESGISEVYDEEGNHVIPSVVIPVPEGAEGPSAPTGQAFNGDANAFGGDRFIFVTEEGTIAGWQRANGSLATLRVDNSASEAGYKGVTIANDMSGAARLFATNFHNASVDVFDAGYAPLTTSGGFVDADIPAGFAPFNVQELDGKLVVTYAKQDEEGEDDVAGPGNGFVDLFDTDGSLIARLISQGELNAPWGIAMTPGDFGSIPHRLLVGNFGDGVINVYVLAGSGGHTQAMHEGTLVDSSGAVLAIDGLWALRFGPGAGGFETDDLYFTAGPDDETHGVFGELGIEAEE
jgi:uncharacterized protein (TIGR03118 family)